MTTTSSRPRLSRPQQGRSEASLARIFDATRGLLEEHTFDQLSIAHIVREARSSVGVFYARFADKQALLDCLDEQYANEVILEFEAAGEDWRRRSLPLRRLVAEATDFLVRFHRERRGLVRALVLHARLHTDGPFTERSQRMVSSTPALPRAFLERRDEIRHPRPKQAVRFAFVQALTMVRERILFPEGPASVTGLADRQLRREVARGWLAYLTFSGESP